MSVLRASCAAARGVVRSPLFEHLLGFSDVAKDVLVEALIAKPFGIASLLFQWLNFRGLDQSDRTRTFGFDIWS